MHEIPKKHPDEYISSNYHRVRQQRVYGLSTRLSYRYLMDCTVSLHSIAQMWCATWQSVAFKKWWKFSPIIWASMHCNWGISKPIFTPAIHKSVMRACWKQCVISHRQSHSHQAMTVQLSRVSDTLVASHMASPVEYKFRKEPYQLNFKQKCNGECIYLSLLKWINIYTIIDTKIFIIITFKPIYVRKDPNYYDISQNISCHIFNFHSICHSSIQYIHRSLKTYILHIYIYIYIDPIYSILYQYKSSTGVLPKVLMYIDLYLYLYSHNLIDYLNTFITGHEIFTFNLK